MELDDNAFRSIWNKKVKKEPENSGSFFILNTAVIA
jgi:hypothetical protein